MTTTGILPQTINTKVATTRYEFTKTGDAAQDKVLRNEAKGRFFLNNLIAQATEAGYPELADLEAAAAKHAYLDFILQKVLKGQLIPDAMIVTAANTIPTV